MPFSPGHDSFFNTEAIAETWMGLRRMHKMNDKDYGDYALSLLVSGILAACADAGHVLGNVGLAAEGGRGEEGSSPSAGGPFFNERRSRDEALKKCKTLA